MANPGADRARRRRRNMFRQVKDNLSTPDKSGISLVRAIIEGLSWGALFIGSATGMLEILRRAAE
jgi:hypothetical protein